MYTDYQFLPPFLWYSTPSPTYNLIHFIVLENKLAFVALKIFILTENLVKYNKIG
jgi:hypothetical protein